MASNGTKVVITAAVIIGGICLFTMFPRPSGFVESKQGVSSANEVVSSSQPESSGIMEQLSKLSQLIKEKIVGGRNDVYKKVEVLPPEVEDGASEALKNLRRKGVSYGLARRKVSSMTEEELRLTVHSTIDQTSTVCHRKLRMGKLDDGGWEICDDVDVRPRQPCVVYSFGINNDFSFDDMTAELYRCHVYSFDPSMKSETHNRSSNVHFYKIGLAERTYTNGKNWTFYKFSDIRKLLGHQKTTIDLVKMDIEYSEWPSVAEMFRNGDMKFKQFLLEMHIRGKGNDEHVKLLQTFELEGYKIFYVHKNPACYKNKYEGFPFHATNCYEVHYLRRP